MQCKCDRNFISEKSRQLRDFFYCKFLNYLTERLTAKNQFTLYSIAKDFFVSWTSHTIIYRLTTYFFARLRSPSPTTPGGGRRLAMIRFLGGCTYGNGADKIILKTNKLL